jgi:hypothetical protein
MKRPVITNTNTTREQTFIAGTPMTRASPAAVLNLDSSWSMSGYYRFDIPLRERDTLRPAEDLQQHRDPLIPGHAGIGRQMSFKRAFRFQFVALVYNVFRLPLFAF